MHIFEDYRKVYEFGRTWSYEEYGSTNKTLRDIRRDMHKQREWRNELERMKISNVVGCLYVDSKSLRNDLMPITTSTLDKIKLLLLNKSRETCMQVRSRRIAMVVEAHGVKALGGDGVTCRLTRRLTCRLIHHSTHRSTHCFTHCLTHR